MFVMSFYQYVTILVSDAPEKFINMAASRGISLWTSPGQVRGNPLKSQAKAVKPLWHMPGDTLPFQDSGCEGLPLFCPPARERHRVSRLCSCLYLLTPLSVIEIIMSS